MPTVHLLDYVAGNIRSLVNAINQVGYEVEWIKSPEDVKNADVCEYKNQPRISFCVMPLLTLWVIEIDSSWRRALWPLSVATRERRLSRPDPTAY